MSNHELLRNTNFLIQKKTGECLGHMKWKVCLENLIVTGLIEGKSDRKKTTHNLLTEIVESHELQIPEGTRCIKEE